MNYKNAAIRAREVVRQSHTPPFQVTQTRPRILALYRQIMRYTNKFTRETPGYRQLQDLPGRDRLRFAVWNAFHKNRFVSDRKSIDVMEYEARFFLLEPLKVVTHSLDRSAGSLVQAQHHIRDIFRRLYTNDHIVEFLASQGLIPSCTVYQSVLNDPALETSPSLQFVRKWNHFLRTNGPPVVRDYEHHKELLELENGTSLTSRGLQFMTWCKSRKAMNLVLTAKKLIHLKDAKIFPPLFGKVYKTKEGSMWTSVWRRSFQSLPPVLDMATFEHLSRLADNIENGRFEAMRVQQMLGGVVGVEESKEGNLVCKAYKPKQCKALKPGEYLVRK
ncbi:hypothetical protein CJU90_2988 [Yarrowia sp. C11]|nr:hypothetical protein CKK34_4437 [Yarrowia sp. E02]KAG5369529.1 hypothetical protein CJU90_2988 [Yarrowia sp. C11]